MFLSYGDHDNQCQDISCKKPRRRRRNIEALVNEEPSPKTADSKEEEDTPKKEKPKEIEEVWV